MHERAQMEITNRLAAKTTAFRLWFAFDALEHLIQTAGKPAASSKAMLALATARKFVACNVDPDGYVLINTDLLEELGDVSRRASADLISGGLAHLAQPFAMATTLDRFTCTSQAKRAIDFLIPQLAARWARQRIRFLSQCYALSGQRTFELLLLDLHPAKIDMTDPITSGEESFLSAEFEEVDWLRVLIWLAFMWLAISLMKLASVFI